VDEITVLVPRMHLGLSFPPLWRLAMFGVLPKASTATSAPVAQIQERRSANYVASEIGVEPQISMRRLIRWLSMKRLALFASIHCLLPERTGQKSYTLSSGETA
jgi:hypothetical protein